MTTHHAETEPIKRVILPYRFDLESVISTAELARRPSRPPDYAAENRALVALAQEMASSPSGILQKLAEIALELCRAHSAGFSLLTDDRKNFSWTAIAGQWARHVGGGTPRDFGPCGTVLDRNAAQLFSRPERCFPYLAAAAPPIEEGLLLPFYVGGEAVGTFWVIVHDRSRRFDAEDLRVMTNLAAFASAAYQSLRSRNAIAASAERFRALVAASAQIVWTVDAQGEAVEDSPSWKAFTGQTYEQWKGRGWLDALHPEDRTRIAGLWDEAIATRSPVDAEYRIRHASGERRWTSVRAVPLIRPNGAVEGWVGMNVDITDRKTWEERQRLLLGELAHRVKNTLAVVQAIAHETLRSSDSSEDFVERFDGRVAALATAHNLLVEANWEGADLAALARNQLLPYAAENLDRVTIDGEPISLPGDLATPFGLVLHELATNAAKHGSLSHPDGTVKLSWTLVPRDNLRLLRAVWREKGGPQPRAPKGTGFGTQLIENAIPGATVNCTFHPDGFLCTIEVSLSEGKEHGANPEP